MAFRFAHKQAALREREAKAREQEERILHLQRRVESKDGYKIKSPTTGLRTRKAVTADKIPLLSGGTHEGDALAIERCSNIESSFLEAGWAQRETVLFGSSESVANRTITNYSTVRALKTAITRITKRVSDQHAIMRFRLDDCTEVVEYEEARLNAVFGVAARAYSWNAVDLPTITTYITKRDPRYDAVQFYPIISQQRTMGELEDDDVYRVVAERSERTIMALFRIPAVSDDISVDFEVQEEEPSYVLRNRRR